MPSGALAAIDLDDPEDNRRAFIKLIGSLDGRPVYDIVRGSVYALVPGRPAQPLFRTVGAGVATYTRQSALEFRAVTRYLGFFLDWESGEPLATPATETYPDGNDCGVVSV